MLNPLKKKTIIKAVCRMILVMSEIKIRGIVVKETFVGEADKIITVIAKDYGKIRINAKGARRAKNKFVSGTSLFSYCDFVIYSKNNYNGLNQVDIIESFYNLTSDLLKLSYASYFAEVLEKTTPENQNANDILLLLLRTLTALKNNKVSPKLSARIFEIKFLQLNGVMPEISSCTACSKDDENLFFGAEGIVCSNCKIPALNYIKITPTVIYTISYILATKTDNLFNFNISEEALEILTSISRLLFREHINLYFKTLQFVEEMEQNFT